MAKKENKDDHLKSIAFDTIRQNYSLDLRMLVFAGFIIVYRNYAKIHNKADFTANFLLGLMQN